ncbi:MAG: type II toxin-antitoxin system PemK/MazF family toxin [Acidobacteria bacterium]|nr:type II toxin-antitoxin system PemK/MazF family toxin [Acidobacteriota bacterium]
MVITRGEIWWADLPEPKGSMPGYRHPIVIIQADPFNRSDLATVIGVVVTTNLALASMPGNVELTSKQSGLPKRSVVNVTQIVTANRSDLLEFVSRLSDRKMEQIELGVLFVLGL